MSRKLKLVDVSTFYGITAEMMDDQSERRGTYDHTAYLVYSLWQFVLTGGTEPKERNAEIARALSNHGFRLDDDEIRAILPQIKRDYFDTFTLPD